jgi:hypothetical protein
MDYLNVSLTGNGILLIRSVRGRLRGVFLGPSRSFDYCLTTFDDSLTASELYPLRYSRGMPGRNIKVKYF